MPLTRRAEPAHARGMASLRRAVIVDDATARRWTLARPRAWDRLLVRWRVRSLDAQLAAGRRAEGSRLRAIRAGLLVAPAARAGLADCWQEVLDRAVSARTVTDPRVPLLRSRVRAVDADIRRMIRALRVSAPVPARGVAIASTLLTDGTGPLYHAHSAQPLRAAVRDAIDHLNPSAELLLSS
jgi:hypothetical protein